MGFEPKTFEFRTNTKSQQNCRKGPRKSISFCKLKFLFYWLHPWHLMSMSLIGFACFACFSASSFSRWRAWSSWEQTEKIILLGATSIHFGFGSFEKSFQFGRSSDLCQFHVQIKCSSWLWYNFYKNLMYWHNFRSKHPLKWVKSVKSSSVYLKNDEKSEKCEQFWEILCHQAKVKNSFMTIYNRIHCSSYLLKVVWVRRQSTW